MLAADQFVITPAGRVEDAGSGPAAGDEVRTVIAGYHWFTDWGRDTMISLEGLTLTTGRQHEAGWILRTFALLRTRRADSQYVPGRGEARPLPHGRCDALVLPCAGPVCGSDERSRDVARDLTQAGADRGSSYRKARGSVSA